MAGQLVEKAALNADVVGYSRLLADDYDTTSAVMTTYHRLVEETVVGSGGVVANFVGDQFMAVFDDPMAAVRTAIAIAAEVEKQNSDRHESGRVRFRMGVDLGQVGSTRDGYHGDALNIAARIQALARPGGLSVSGRVYRSLDEPALRFRPMGRHRLKNIPEQVDVYEFVDLPTGTARPGSPVSLSLEAPTIAVLPIHTETVDDEVRSAATVIRLDLIHRLAQMPELTVVDAGTAAGDPGPNTARYMLETGVHQFGESVRIYATLFDVTTMNVVKSLKWTAGTVEMAVLSDAIADEVARALEVELIVGEPAGLYAELDDPEAIENVYLGWYHLRTDTPEGWAHAVDLFGRVAVAHPDRPYGHVLSAFANWIGASNEWSPDPDATLLLARDQAQRGIETGDPTGMGQAVDAAVLMSLGRVQEALEAMDNLEIVRPTCDVTFGLEGSVRRYMGDWEKAVDLLDIAMRLTGINKPWYPTVKACSYYVGGRTEQAAALAEAVLEYQPHNLEALLVLAAAQEDLGLERRARGTAQLISSEFPGVDIEAWLDRSPYQHREVVDRWKRSLAAAGVMQA